MISIRPALSQDIHDCVYIAGVFHAGSQFRDVSVYNPADAYDHAVYSLQSPEKLFLVLEDEKGVCGFFIAGRHHPVWNKKEYISAEELFYILEDRRKGAPRVTLKLFKIWEAWARNFGALQMYFNPTSFTEENADRWDSFCKVTGFKRLGVSYKKVLDYAEK